jgi:hypothetical protein
MTTPSSSSLPRPTATPAALNTIEAAATLAGAGGTITAEAAREAMQLRFARYDKGGEEHFNILSAYHKSLRGSDVDARAVLDGPHDRGRPGSPHHLPARHRHGGGGHRHGGPQRAPVRRRGTGGVPRARPARGVPAAGGDDGLPGDGAEVERVLPRAERRPRSRAPDTPAPVPSTSATRPRPHEGARLPRRATGTPTTTRRASSSSSTCPTS